MRSSSHRETEHIGVLGLIERFVDFCLLSSGRLRTTVLLVRDEADYRLCLDRFVTCCLLSSSHLHTMVPFAGGVAGSRPCLGGLSAGAKLALEGFPHRCHSFQ